MRIITLVVVTWFVTIAGCGLLHQQMVCDEYGEAAGVAAAEMCVSTIKENADAAQKRWSKRAETDVLEDVRKEP